MCNNFFCKKSEFVFNWKLMVLNWDSAFRPPATLQVLALNLLLLFLICTPTSLNKEFLSKNSKSWGNTEQSIQNRQSVPLLRRPKSMGSKIKPPTDVNSIIGRRLLGPYAKWTLFRNGESVQGKHNQSNSQQIGKSSAAVFTSKPLRAEICLKTAKKDNHGNLDLDTRMLSPECETQKVNVQKQLFPTHDEVESSSQGDFVSEKNTFLKKTQTAVDLHSARASRRIPYFPGHNVGDSTHLLVREDSASDAITASTADPRTPVSLKNREGQKQPAVPQSNREMRSLPISQNQISLVPSNPVSINRNSGGQGTVYDYEAYQLLEEARYELDTLKESWKDIMRAYGSSQQDGNSLSLIYDLRDELQRSNAEKSNLTAELCKISSDYISVCHKLDVLERQQNEVENIKLIMKTHVEEARKTIDILKAAQATQNETAAREVNESSSLIRDLQFHVKDLESKLKAANAEREDILVECEDLRQQTDSLQQDATDAEQMHSGLQQQLSVLRQALEKAESDQAELAERLKREQKSHDELVKRYEDAVQAELQARKAAANEVAEAEASLKSKELAANETLLSLKTENFRLKSQLQHLEQRLSNVTLSWSNEMNINNKLQKELSVGIINFQKAEREKLLLKQSEQDHLKSWELQRQELQMECQKFKEELLQATEQAQIRIEEEKRTKLHEMTNQAKEFESTQALLKEDFQRRIDSLQEEFNFLNTSSNRKTLMVQEDLKRELSIRTVLEKNLSISQLDVRRLQDKVWRLANASLAAEARIRGLEQELRTTRDQLHSAVSRSEVVQEYARSLERREADKIALLENVTNSNKLLISRAESAEATLMQLRNENSRLSSEIFDAIKHQIDSNMTISRMQCELSDAKILRAQFAEAVSNLSTLNVKFNEQDQLNKILEKRCDDLEAQLFARVDEINQTSLDLEKQKALTKEAQGRCQEIEKNLVEERDAARTIQSQLGLVQVQMSHVRSQIDTATRDKEDLTCSLKEKEGELERLKTKSTEDINIERNKCEEMCRKIEHLKEEHRAEVEAISRKYQNQIDLMMNSSAHSLNVLPASSDSISFVSRPEPQDAQKHSIVRNLPSPVCENPEIDALLQSAIAQRTRGRVSSSAERRSSRSQVYGGAVQLTVTKPSPPRSRMQEIDDIIRDTMTSSKAIADMASSQAIADETASSKSIADKTKVLEMDRLPVLPTDRSPTALPAITQSTIARRTRSRTTDHDSVYLLRHVPVPDQSRPPKIPAVVQLTHTGFTIGRFGADLDLMRDFVSRRHAQLQRTSTGWRVLDSSTNGLCVNGTRVRSHLLSHGDVLLFEVPSAVAFGQQVPPQSEAHSLYRFRFCVQSAAEWACERQAADDAPPGRSEAPSSERPPVWAG